MMPMALRKRTHGHCSCGAEDIPLREDGGLQPHNRPDGSRCGNSDGRWDSGTCPLSHYDTHNTVRLVEVCAGSAAVTLEAMGAALPLYYRGGKRRHARQIVEALRRVAGEHYGALRYRLPRQGFASYTLNEPGMFGEFWAAVNIPSLRHRLVVELRRLHDTHGALGARGMWTLLAGRQVPDDLIERVAVRVALQRHSYGGRPVDIDDPTAPYAHLAERAGVDLAPGHRLAGGRLWRAVPDTAPRRWATGGFIGAAAADRVLAAATGAVRAGAGAAWMSGAVRATAGVGRVARPLQPANTASPYPNPRHQLRFLPPAIRSPRSRLRPAR